MAKPKSKKRPTPKRCLTAKQRLLAKQKLLAKKKRLAADKAKAKAKAKGSAHASATAKPKPKVKAKPKPKPKKRSVTACRTKKRKPLPTFAAFPPVATAAPLTRTVAVLPAPVFEGAFGRREAERLLWRAGFGPRPGEAEALATLGLRGAVQSLTRPDGAATYAGPEPSVTINGARTGLQPRDLDGHDHLWWLDRMVRSSQPLVERMALIWHDWFATSNADVGQRPLMIDQNELLRRLALGSFEQLLLDVTRDPAMLRFLDGIANRKGKPNENYARELMELFTLGADRGAYTEADIREAARGLTGFNADYQQGTGFVNFRYEPARHDDANKTIFGQTAAFGWEDVCRLCLNSPYHASFFVLKLWSYFVPTPPDRATQAALEQTYIGSGHSIRHVVEAILMHPAVYAGSPMVKPPAVFSAGLLRALGRAVDGQEWRVRGAAAGQRLFYPPNVSGWNDQAWLDTSTLNYRWRLVALALTDRYVRDNTGYSETETPEEALAAALSFWGNPTLTTETLGSLLEFARTSMPSPPTANHRGQRQNALRQLVAASPDLQTS